MERPSKRKVVPKETRSTRKGTRTDKREETPPATTTGPSEGKRKQQRRRRSTGSSGRRRRKGCPHLWNPQWPSLGLDDLVVVVLQGDGSGSSTFCLQLLLPCLIDVHLTGLQGGCLHKGEVVVIGQFLCKPKKRLLKVVVRLCGDVIVLQVLLPVECDLLGLHRALHNVHLVAHQDNRDVFAHPDNVTVPVGDVFVGLPRGDVKHDDSAVSLNVVAVSETSKLLLARSIPHIETDFTPVRVERQRVDLNTDGCNVLFLKFSCEMPLDKRGLPSTTVADQNQLESCHNLIHGHCWKDFRLLQRPVN
eukprot:RCo031825